jgi:hypothetical protein
MEGAYANAGKNIYGNIIDSCRYRHKRALSGFSDKIMKIMRDF